MKQIALQTVSSPVARALTAWCLLAACVFSILSYSYFVSKAIFRASASSHLTVSSSEVSERINALESKYLRLSNAVTISRAETLGFVEVSKKQFINRQSLGKGLSLRDEL